MSTLRTLIIVAAVLLAACSPAAPAPTPTVALPTPALALFATATAVPSVAGAPKQWSAPPAMAIDPAKFYLATFKTEKGDFQIELLARQAPITVNNFVFLARQGYYDGTTFHRVLENFMAQGGDPTGTGGGGPGYQFGDEFDPDLRFDGAGLLAMANGGPNTNGSQFFVTFGPTPHLNFRHTIFGKVVSGMDVVLSLRLRDPQTGPDFTGDVLNTVLIQEMLASLLPPPTPTPIPVVPELVDGRPLSELDIAARENLYTGRPAMIIDPAQTYTATITTTQGDIVVALLAADAPESVNNFVVLAVLGYWDGFPIVHVQSGEFILTGSPAARPDSDIGYTLPDELKQLNTAGAVGYWFREDQFASSGSEFYILMQDAPVMNERFTVFGRVVAGQDVVEALTTADKIERITIAPSVK